MPRRSRSSRTGCRSTEGGCFRSGPCWPWARSDCSPASGSRCSVRPPHPVSSSISFAHSERTFGLMMLTSGALRRSWCWPPPRCSLAWGIINTGDEPGLSMNERERLTVRFEEHKPRLRAVAYRMLGSLAEADDVLQEAWLRICDWDTGSVEDLQAWLTTVVGRLCLNVLRSRRMRLQELSEFRVPDPVVSFQE